MITGEYDTLDDQAHTIHVTVDEGRVTAAVSGARAEVTRVSGSVERPGIPIGTRDIDELRFTVNGEACTFTLGRGRLSRHSYRVRFDIGGVTYTQVPVTDVENALRRGRTELARYLIADDGRVETFQSGHHTPSAIETAAGVALAAAFGCGARHCLDALVDAVTGGGASS